MTPFDSLPNTRYVVPFSPRHLLRVAAVWLAFVTLGNGVLQAQDKVQLAGMGQEIEVKPAKALSIEAPSGENVAVLDQSGASEGDMGSKVQDHHNGWLTLSTNKVEGKSIKVKGKYYVPSAAKAPPKEIRFTVRKPQPGRLAQFSEKNLTVDAVDKWVDFELELSLTEDGEITRPEAKFVLLLSAVPFAGPVYLDNLQVTDPQGNALWDFPEFESE